MIDSSVFMSLPEENFDRKGRQESVGNFAVCSGSTPKVYVLK